MLREYFFHLRHALTISEVAAPNTLTNSSRASCVSDTGSRWGYLVAGSVNTKRIVSTWRTLCGRAGEAGEADNHVQLSPVVINVEPVRLLNMEPDPYLRGTKLQFKNIQAWGLLKRNVVAEGIL